MPSKPTQLVIDRMNEANIEAVTQLQILDCDKRRYIDSCDRKQAFILELKNEIRELEDEKYARQRLYEITMILMIISLVFGFVAIGYAVWV